MFIWLLVWSNTPCDFFFDHWLFRYVLFSIYLWIFQFSFVIDLFSFHCGQKRYFVWFPSFKCIETCFVTYHRVYPIECFMCTWEECVFCCCWVECFTYDYYVSWVYIGFQVLYSLTNLSSHSVHHYLWCIGASNYYFRTIYFSLLFLKYLLHLGLLFGLSLFINHIFL